MTGIAGLLRQLLSAFANRPCLLCRQNPAGPEGICPLCREKLLTEAAEPCPDCGMQASRCRCSDLSLSPLPAFLTSGSDSRTWLAHCWYHPLHGADITSTATAALLLTCKKHYSPLLAAHIAHAMAEDLAPYLPSDRRKDWILTWAPRSAAGYAKNGFDQCEEIVRQLGREMGIPVRRLLVRCGGGEQKNMENAAARQTNASLAFAADRVPAGCRVLLFDDIVTTGATMREAGQVLACSGAACVFPLVYARVVSADASKISYRR